MPGNQTKEEWLQLPDVAGNPDALGTGIALPKPRESKTLIENVKYDDILGMDAHERFFAFSWVPHVVASFDQIRSTPCNARCSQTCVRPGCICDRSIGVCR
jgi:hypothetical protein